MTMLRVVSTYEVAVIVGVLFLIVAGKLLSGEIETRGLLQVKGPGVQHELSPARVQLLLMTFAGSFEYLTEVLKQYPSHTMPAPPDTLVTARMRPGGRRSHPLLALHCVGTAPGHGVRGV